MLLDFAVCPLAPPGRFSTKNEKGSMQMPISPSKPGSIWSEKVLRVIAKLWTNFRVWRAMAKLDRAERRLNQAATDLQDARVELNHLVEAPAPLLDRENR